MSFRKAFKFYRSYFDVYNEIKSDKDKKQYIEAILRKQFYGEEPTLKGVAKFAYISQQHSIDAQVKGYEDKTGTTLAPLQDPMQGGYLGPSIEEKEKEEEQEQEKIYRKFKHLKLTVKEFDKLSETYSKEQIDNILDKIENYSKNKNYTSLYLTCNNWLKKEAKEKPKPTAASVKYLNYTQ